VQSISNGALFELKRTFQTTAVTAKLRYVKRSWGHSQRETLVLQQWVDGEWRNVPIVDETYPLPDGRPQ
jgi:hypothetical protein